MPFTSKTETQSAQEFGHYLLRVRCQYCAISAFAEHIHYLLANHGAFPSP